MFRIPEWALKSTAAEDMDALLEWRLDARDVAELTDTTVMSVSRWATVGRRGEVLASRRFAEGPNSPRAFRLVDVKQFCERIDVFVDLEKLHPTLIKQWNIDTTGNSAKVGRNE